VVPRWKLDDADGLEPAADDKSLITDARKDACTGTTVRYDEQIACRWRVRAHATHTHTHSGLLDP